MTISDLMQQAPGVIMVLAITARHERIIRDIREDQSKQTSAFLGTIDGIVQKYGSVVRNVTEQKKE